MRRFFRLFLSLALIAVGLLLAAGDAFLAAWEAGAGEHQDIATRGPWLLALYVPFFTLGAALVAGLLLVPLGRRHQLAPWPRVLLPVGAALTAAAILYADPFTLVWRVLQPLRAALGPGGAAVLDGLLVVAGVALLLRARPAPSPSAAAAV